MKVSRQTRRIEVVGRVHKYVGRFPFRQPFGSYTCPFVEEWQVLFHNGMAYKTNEWVSRGCRKANR